MSPNFCGRFFSNIWLNKPLYTSLCIYISMTSWFESIDLDEELTYLKYKKVAEEKGLTNVSRKPNNYVWRCKRGHEFTTKNVSTLKLKKFPCKKCVEEDGLKKLREFGEKMGLTLVSKKGPKWKCKRGHIIKRSITKKPKKCMKCRMEDHLDNAIRIIEEKGGKAIDVGEHRGTETPIKFECKNGHIRKFKAGQIERGSWCDECYRGSVRIGLSKFQEIAEKHGGKCLSDRYISLNKKLTFECKNGHVFEEECRNILRRRTFCLICKEGRLHEQKIKKRKKMEKIRKDRAVKRKEERERRAHEHAKRKGGEVIWIKKHRVRWRCKNGHEWNGSIGKEVTNDVWCPECHLKEFYREDMVAKTVEDIYPNKFRRPMRPNWLRNPKTGWPLELDFYSKSLKIAIEVNGRQHYEYSPPFHKTEKDLKYTKWKDEFKARKCKEMGVFLIIIPYTIPPDDLDGFVRGELEKASDRKKDKKLSDFW